MIAEIYPEEKQYQKAVELEHRLDQFISRKRAFTQALTAPPIIISKKLRIFVSHVYHRLDSPMQIPKWELRIESRLMDDCDENAPILPPSHQSIENLITKSKTSTKKFTDFFSRISVELDPRLYGTTQNVIEWKRDPANPTDGCVIVRNGDSDVQITIKVWCFEVPQKYKIHPYIAKLLGFGFGAKNRFLEALYMYIKTQKLQDSEEKQWINCDSHLELIFGVKRLKMNEIGLRIQKFLSQPDPYVINHTIRVEDKTKPIVACFDVDVEINDTSSAEMSERFESLEKTIQDENLKIADIISRLKRSKDFFNVTNNFANDPAGVLHDIIKGYSADLKTMQENFNGFNPPTDAEYYTQKNMKDAVDRYLWNKIAQQRAVLEAGISVRR